MDNHICKGITQKGHRCKRKLAVGYYCYQHTNIDQHTSKKQCKGITLKGKRCKRQLITGDYCYQHSSHKHKLVEQKPKEHCKGITMKGTMCARKASHNGYCYQHSEHTRNILGKIKKKETIPKIVKNNVWHTYIGRSITECECLLGCGDMISQIHFDCGHVVAEAKGGKVTVENLRPICGTCNKSMGTNNMLEFIDKYELNVHENIRAISVH